MGEARSGHAVVLIHGLLQSPRWMAPLARDLRRAGFARVIRLGYGRGPDLARIAERLADQLRRELAEHDGPVHALGLSMGGLLLRRLHADGALPPDPAAHYLTLGTPHRGAAKASWGLARFPRLAPFLYGPTLRDLHPDSAFLAGLPPLPPMQTTSLYAGSRTGAGRSRVLRTDNDGVVETSSAHLPGAHNIRLRPVHHYWLSLHPAVRRVVVERLCAATGGPGAAPAHPRTARLRSPRAIPRPARPRR